MCLNAYVPGLQYTTGLIGYVDDQLRKPIASTAPLGGGTDPFTDAIDQFAKDRHIERVDFAKACASTTS